MVRDQAQSSTRGGGCLLLAMAAIVIVTAAIAIPTVGDVTLSEHAVERHGQDAVIAREWTASHAEAYNRWDCPDGRTRLVTPFDKARWAVMVILERLEITSFLCDDQYYICWMLDPCKPYVPYAHP